MSFTDDPAYDASVWEDEQEAKHHKFEQECYNLSFEDEYSFTTYESLCEALRCMWRSDIDKLEVCMEIADDRGYPHDFEALGRFVLESSRLYQMERIKEAVSSQSPKFLD